MRFSCYIPVLVTALALSGCPSVPPVVPLVDALTEGRSVEPMDATVASPDTRRQPSAQATEFGPCERATDCLTYPNSASVCDFQTCALQCVPGFANCDRETVNGCEQSLSTPDHCGGCDTSCAPSNAFGSCATGACLVAACNLGFGDCDALSDNGCETLLVTVDNCGACGVPCAADNAQMTCDGGVCAIKACQPGFGDCDGALENGCEMSVDTPSRCGGCEVTCEPGQGCAFDHCAPVLSEPIDAPTPIVALAADSDGALYMAATLSGSVSWPTSETLLSAQGDADVLLIKEGVGEGASWVQRFGGLNRDRAVDVVVDANSHVSVTGTFQSGFKVDGALLPHTGGEDVFLLSLDAEGAPRWALGLGGLGDDSASGLAVGPDNSLVLIAEAHSPASFGGEVVTSQEGEELGVIAAYTDLGAVRYARAIVSAGSLTLHDVLVDAEGAAHVLVTSDGAAAEISGEVLGEGPMIVTWSSVGAFVAARPIDLASVSALAQDGEGTLWVAGLDDQGGARLHRLDADATLSVEVPSVQSITSGVHGDLYVAGLSTGAFDVGLGPVVVETSYAARYDRHTGEAVWFVDLGALAAPPALASTQAGAAVGGEIVVHLEE